MYDEPIEPARPPSLARAIRESFGRLLDEPILFLGGNFVWALLLAAFALVRVGVPIAVLLGPLLALPTAVLMRLAVVAARDRAPNLAAARDELGRLAGRKVVLGAIQLLVLGVALGNLLVGGDIGGVAGVASALVAGYAVIAVTVYALALWPIVCDPAREAPVGQQLRLALAVVVLRPLQMLVLGLITVLAVLLSIQLIVPIVFLPALVLIVVAGYVVPLADGLRAPAD